MAGCPRAGCPITGVTRVHYADPDASWGHRSAISTRKGGGFYGYKLHAAVCTKTDLPLAWRVQTASDSEHEHMASLLNTVIGRAFTPGRARWTRGTTGPGSTRPASPATSAPSSH